MPHFCTIRSLIANPSNALHSTPVLSVDILNVCPKMSLFFIKPTLLTFPLRYTDELLFLRHPDGPIEVILLNYPTSPQLLLQGMLVNLSERPGMTDVEK